MYFDSTIQCYTMDVIPVVEGHHVILQFSAGVIVPGPPTPPGEPQAQALIPIGVYKIPTGYRLAEEFRDELTNALSKIEPPPPPSKLIVAQGPGAEQGANALAAQQTAAEKELKGK